MSALQPLETTLNDLFVKNAPPLPDGGKKALVQYLPWINLAFGLFSLYSVWVLWHWAHFANQFINYANSLSAITGGPTVSTNRMGLAVWLALGVLLVEAVLYLLAFPATRDRKKSGWDLMFYAALVNIVYAVVVMFSNYGGIGSLLVSLVGSAIGLYLLFQIRASYLKKQLAPKEA